MTIKPAPIPDDTLLRTNKFTQSWSKWFNSIFRILAGLEPLQLASYTVVDMPIGLDAPSLIYVSDATGGSIPAFWDGTNWRRVDTRAIVT